MHHPFLRGAVAKQHSIMYGCHTCSGHKDAPGVPNKRRCPGDFVQSHNALQVRTDSAGNVKLRAFSEFAERFGPLFIVIVWPFHVDTTSG